MLLPSVGHISSPNLSRHDAFGFVLAVLSIFIYCRDTSFQTPHSIDASMAQQFSFMRLPLELRLCVYEQITISQVQKKIVLRPSLLDSVTDPTARPPALVTRNGKEQSARRETDVVLHISALPIGILATYRQVNQEVRCNGAGFCHMICYPFRTSTSNTQICRSHRSSIG